MGSEKRVSRRVTVNHEFASVNEFLREYAENVSEGGVFIRTSEVVPIGTDVDLAFSVIVDDFESIEGEGRVVRVAQEGEPDGPGIGVVFTRLTPESQAVLAKLFVRPVSFEDADTAPGHSGGGKEGSE